MKQKTALEILKTGQNVFITGEAGTGKTYLLNKYIDYLKKKKIIPDIVAPTAIAASHLNGTTIHSFFSLGLKNTVDEFYIDNLTQKKYLYERFKELEILIIDEISMVPPQLFNTMDKIIKVFKNSNEPFGGIQVVISGDFFQLPPVFKGKNSSLKFAWQSDAWRKLDLKTVYLEEKFRQKDIIMTKILDQIRSNNVDDNNIKILKETKKNIFKIEPIKLYTHNTDIDIINNNELNRIKGEEKVFYSIKKRKSEKYR